MRPRDLFPFLLLFVACRLSQGWNCDCLGLKLLKEEAEPKPWAAVDSFSVDLPHSRSASFGRFALDVQLVDAPAAFTDYTVEYFVEASVPPLFTSCADCGACPDAGCGEAWCSCPSQERLVLRSVDLAGEELACLEGDSTTLGPCVFKCISKFPFGSGCQEWAYWMKIDTADPRFSERDAAKGTANVRLVFEILHPDVPASEYLHFYDSSTKPSLPYAELNRPVRIQGHAGISGSASTPEPHGLVVTASLTAIP